MKYKILHRTTYRYKYPVSVGNHVACLKPRALPHQHVADSEIVVMPTPVTSAERADFYGNTQCVFTVQKPHRELVVEARSFVTVTPPTQIEHSIAWEDAVAQMPVDTSVAGLAAYQFTFESPRIRVRPDFADYALQSFTPQRPIAEALMDLTTRIYRDFRFDAKATNVRTPPEEVFKKRHGVCQDFAHVQIACLRSINVAARYVSGYLRTYPPPGKPRLIGADASHAWVSAWCPGSGWLDLDPTNNLIPSDGHVTLAWGRDYSDVSPLRGLVLGGGAHTLKVGVDMEPQETEVLEAATA
jgi:transglutaminase-like putative cysteine protease